MANFYKRLSYSIGNEDWKTEAKALNIKPNDHVLAVTASGDRPLNLLLTDCKEIISVDANPFQTALCDLKKAAISKLDYEEYLAFLGIHNGKGRLQTLRKIEPFMEKKSVECWRQAQEKIERGVLYQGSVEKLLQKASLIVRAVGKKNITPLFSFNNIHEQQAFMEKNWNEKAWKKVFELVLNPLFTRFLVQDPGLYAYLDPNIRISNYLYSRMEGSLKRFLAKENIIVSLLFQGKVFSEGFSPHLTEEGVQKIRKNLDRLSCKTMDILSYLEKAKNESIDCFSLSDIASYMTREDFHRVAREIYRVAKPGARFCIRQFMSSHEFPSDLTGRFQRDHELEKNLEEEDRCFVYRFKAGTILKGRPLF